MSFLLLPPKSKLRYNSLKPEPSSKSTTTLPENASVSKVAKAHIPLAVAATSIKPALTSPRSTRLEDLPNEILCKITSNLGPPELSTLSDASRRLTILIGPVPCGDAFTWARHRCLVNRHVRRAFLCGDCIAALIASNKYDLARCFGPLSKRLTFCSRSICKQDHAAWASAWQYV